MYFHMLLCNPTKLLTKFCYFPLIHCHFIKIKIKIKSSRTKTFQLYSRSSRMFCWNANLDCRKSHFGASSRNLYLKQLSCTVVSLAKNISPFLRYCLDSTYMYSTQFSYICLRLTSLNDLFRLHNSILEKTPA